MSSLTRLTRTTSGRIRAPLWILGLLLCLTLIFSLHSPKPGAGTAPAKEPVEGLRQNSATPPAFQMTPYNFMINENVAGVIGTVSATDGDGDTLVYSIAQAGTDAGITINTSTGALSTTGLNHEETETITFNVSVNDSDGVNDGHTSTESVTVTVNDVNERPRFTGSENYWGMGDFPSSPHTLFSRRSLRLEMEPESGALFEDPDEGDELSYSVWYSVSTADIATEATDPLITWSSEGSVVTLIGGRTEDSSEGRGGLLDDTNLIIYATDNAGLRAWWPTAEIPEGKTSDDFDNGNLLVTNIFVYVDPEPVIVPEELDKLYLANDHSAGWKLYPFGDDMDPRSERGSGGVRWEKPTGNPTNLNCDGFSISNWTASSYEDASDFNLSSDGLLTLAKDTTYAAPHDTNTDNSYKVRLVTRVNSVESTGNITFGCDHDTKAITVEVLDIPPPILDPELPSIEDDDDISGTGTLDTSDWFASEDTVTPELQAEVLAGEDTVVSINEDGEVVVTYTGDNEDGEDVTIRVFTFTDRVVPASRTFDIKAYPTQIATPSTSPPTTQPPAPPPPAPAPLPPPPAPRGDRFIDIATNTHRTNINALADLGITRGCNPPENTRYCPNRSVTRGEMATFLTRAFRLANTLQNLFEDDDDTTHEVNINRLAAAEITRGCNPPDNTEYCPFRAVTRAEMATFLVRGLNLTQEGDREFEDIEESVHQGNILLLAEAGITRGCNPPDNTEFCPERAVNRGEMATFIVRANEIFNS